MVCYAQNHPILVFFKIFQESFVIFFSNCSDFDFSLDVNFVPLIQAQHVVLVSGEQ